MHPHIIMGFYTFMLEPVRNLTTLLVSSIYKQPLTVI